VFGEYVTYVAILLRLTYVFPSVPKIFHNNLGVLHYIHGRKQETDSDRTVAFYVLHVMVSTSTVMQRMSIKHMPNLTSN
jgi:hypothetical protein